MYRSPSFFLNLKKNRGGEERGRGREKGRGEIGREGEKEKGRGEGGV